MKALLLMSLILCLSPYAHAEKKLKPKLKLQEMFSENEINQMKLQSNQRYDAQKKSIELYFGEACYQECTGGTGLLRFIDRQLEARQQRSNANASSSRTQTEIGRRNIQVKDSIKGNCMSCLDACHGGVKVSVVNRSARELSRIDQEHQENGAKNAEKEIDAALLSLNETSWHQKIHPGGAIHRACMKKTGEFVSQLSGKEWKCDQPINAYDKKAEKCVEALARDKDKIIFIKNLKGACVDTSGKDYVEVSDAVCLKHAELGRNFLTTSYQKISESKFFIFNKEEKCFEVDDLTRGKYYKIEASAESCQQTSNDSIDNSARGQEKPETEIRPIPSESESASQQ